ncbi:MAG: deoxyguanosinetriphosphate triphosphohydrolase [Gammaproteobacteria bacterium]
MTLAPYAVDSAQTRGRRRAEPPPAWRDEFQRDRDRVIHSSAFRRLEYKTQVFVNHEGDMFRTRLTHTLEVAQIARTVARALHVNEDLTEAIALAHDLGHTPFGHAGQHALDACMKPWGGFEHNLQLLRVVDELERRYARFDGLNLLFETREGILKHCRAQDVARLGELGERFRRGLQPSLEAQIANLADEIAYNHHDIDDGLRSGILSLDSIAGHAVFRTALETSRAAHPGLDGRRLEHTALRAMLGSFANDLIASSRARLAASGCQTVDDVRAAAEPLVDFSPAMREHHLSLKRLLHRELYNDARVRRFTDAARETVRELFEIFLGDTATLPGERRVRADTPLADSTRAICDYIAGMTDRFAIAEHRRLVGTPRWPDDLFGG